MARAGLNTADVIAAAAELADARGIEAVSLTAVAEQLGVRPPALYKHINGITDLQRGIASLAMTELGDAIREAVQGKTRRAAVEAIFRTARAYIAEHPGRYSATTGADLQQEDDPLVGATTRLIDVVREALSSYRIPSADLDHAIRTLRCTIHGYALLQAGDAFQWSNDPDETMDWMIRFIDTGLTEAGQSGPSA
ncbi:TetR family transcriptional regulator [Epidermidibacterium keratini]|uniref:TetR family transcriptional regulator n=1 Tax=Epidermidibacterium keratini TaxID=1891644 RepID=A0A7L4YLY5_9ACTN|nr:TetR-like C-terminal domain-containing protein [Epidermidibacterium keratini]QHC00062.1 TetR family transcriptional regulator [Epidermidibacterium keratini]